MTNSQKITTGDWVSLVQGDTKSKWFVERAEGKNDLYVTHEDERHCKPMWVDRSMVRSVMSPSYQKSSDAAMSTLNNFFGKL